MGDAGRSEEGWGGMGGVVGGGRTWGYKSGHWDSNHGLPDYKANTLPPHHTHTVNQLGHSIITFSTVRNKNNKQTQGRTYDIH